MSLLEDSDNLKAVYDNIAEAALRVGRSPDDVTLVGVSKGQEVEHMLALASLGVNIFAESRLQEALEKMKHFTTHKNINFHFIGRIQTNKLKNIVGNFELIHSVDSISQIDIINKYAASKKIVQKILLQVNLAEERQKGGVLRVNLDNMVSLCLNAENLLLEGFMIIPPFENDPEHNRKYFRQMKEIFDKYKKTIPEIDVLSMGMSDDYTIAVEEGATMVRVGTSLFGKRAYEEK